MSKKEKRYKFSYGFYDIIEKKMLSSLICSKGYINIGEINDYIQTLRTEGYNYFTKTEEYEIEAGKTIEFDPQKITRVEFIGENSRELVKYRDNFDFSVQDDGRTLKIFGK